MNKVSPTAEVAAESSARRKAARPRLLLAIPPLLLLVHRLANLGDVDAAAWWWALGLMGPIFIISGVGVFAVYHRRLRGLAALVGRGGWTASCADPDDARRWQGLLVDDAGVRSADRSGVVHREWAWKNIREVSLERFQVEFFKMPGVVLYLADGSRAEILLASSIGTYTAGSAETAANEICRRLAVFDARRDGRRHGR